MKHQSGGAWLIPMKLLRQILAWIGAITVIALVVAVAVVGFGIWDVGALGGPPATVAAALGRVTARSVHAHARGVRIPAGTNLRDPALARRAVADYNEMCLLCHGAPGRKPAFWTKGLYPAAPDLTDRQREQQWSDADVYWIIKHGVAHTGMTAFGATHDEDELWALTALVRQFLSITPAQYAVWSAQAKAEPEEKER